MKFDLYFWPINQQAWVLSWGLRDAMNSMGVLNKFGNIEEWRDAAKIPKLLNTSADVIMFVGIEHFKGKIPTNKIVHSKAKIACWTYESLTDPYGAIGWDTAVPKHFLQLNSEFHTGFTKQSDLSYFDCMDILFCADELDYERFKADGRKAFWLPFGVDESIFRSDTKVIPQEKNQIIQAPTNQSLVDKAKVRYGTRYGVRSGRSHPLVSKATPTAPSSGALKSGAAFIGTKSNIRTIILGRMNSNIVTLQTPRKGSFGVYETAVKHTQDLSKAYNGYTISVNIVSIFGGITPRATESMSCGKALFQYLAAPNRPMSRKMLTNCIKYEVFTNNGLNAFREKLRHYIMNPQEALTLGREARSEILMGHTLKHRISTMIEKIRKVTGKH